MLGVRLRPGVDIAMSTDGGGCGGGGVGIKIKFS
jgi:hypothetical protein